MDKIKTIIFDFGNVVGFFDHRRTLNRLAAHTDMSPEEMYAIIYDGTLEDEFESGRLTGADFLCKFRDLCRLNCTPELLAEAFADIFQANPEVCSLLPLLKPRHRVLLGSNTNEVHARQFRGQFANHLRYFDGLVLSYEIGARKPQRLFFENAQRLTQCEPRQCLFIDDLAANVQGARDFGWQAIQYSSGNGLVKGLQAAGVAI